MPCFDLVVMRQERSPSMAPLELLSDSRHGRISVNGGVHIPSLRRWNEIAAKEFCMKIRINYSLCTGHGRCYSLVPDLFSADEAGLGTAIAEDLNPEQIQDAELAVQNCPEQAISLV
jgi:ferredoxin